MMAQWQTGEQTQPCAAVAMKRVHVVPQASRQRPSIPWILPDFLRQRVQTDCTVH